MVEPQQNQPKRYLAWDEFELHLNTLEKTIRAQDQSYLNIYAVPRGGLVIGTMLSHRLQIPMIFSLDQISRSTLVVDDICDSGDTLEKIMAEINNSANRNYHVDTLTLCRRTDARMTPDYSAFQVTNKDWIVFPWENRN